MRSIAIIPARKGSKGLPRKNVLDFHGKPLIAHSIEQAINSKCFDAIICTTDDKEVINIARQYNIQYIERPESLASDTASMNDVILHTLQSYNAQNFCLLQPTSPNRTILDIQNALNLFQQSNVSNLIAVTENTKSPYFAIIKKNESGRLSTACKLHKQIIRRQDAPKCYDINGAIYIWKTDVFHRKSKLLYKDTIIYEMPKERSIDIDTLLDFQIAELLYSRTKFDPI